MNREHISHLVAALAMCWALSLEAQNAPRSELTQKFRDRLAEIARTTNGVVGLAVIDLKSGERFGVNDGASFPQGSAIKIPILLELYAQAEAGTLRIDERIPIRASDQVGGTGVTQWFGDGQSALSLRDLAVLMINLSDNTATNMLIDRLGMDKVNGTLRSLELGAIRVQRKMIRPRESASGAENIATPAAAAALMQRIHSCAIPVSRERCADLRRILELPKGGPILASVPNGVPVAWKPGSVEGVETAWGLVALPGNPYVVVAMVTFSEAADASAAIQAIANAAAAYFQRLARASAYGVRVPLSLVDSIRKLQ